MLKPTKLFGVEQKRQNVFFIHYENEGYWFLSTNCRLVGEAKSLKESTTAMQKMELANSWLILEILNKNKDKVKAEYRDKNPDELPVDELAKLLNSNSEELDMNLEIFLRAQIREGNFTNPVLWEYRDKLTDNILSQNTFDYQLDIVKAGFKYRVITDESYITKDDDDPEKGYIKAHDLVGQDFIGYNVSDLDISELKERLVLQIYRFLQYEYNGNQWLTTKEIEALNKNEVIPELAPEDEKKNDVSKQLEESKTKEKPLVGMKST